MRMVELEYTRYCAVCGVALPLLLHARIKFCSDDCRKVHLRAYSRESRKRKAVQAAE